MNTRQLVIRRVELQGLFLNRLVESQKQRKVRADWVFFERGVMLAAVNEERTRSNLPPCCVEMIEKVERLAVGHSDYSSKFALYCAELALGEV